MSSGCWPKAARSAGNSDCQPWRVHVLTGAAKRALSADLLGAHDEGRRSAGEFPYQPGADEWREPFRSRRRRFGEGLYRTRSASSPATRPAASATTGATATSSAPRWAWS